MRDFKVYQASGYLNKLVTDASDVRKEYEEISGSLVQFDTPISAPLASLIVDINPVQSGTGDPSPDNIRPITGWTEVNVYQSGEDTANPTVYTISWQDEAGTVYGGTVDVVNGMLTVDMASVDMGALNWNYNSQYSFFQSNDIADGSTVHMLNVIPNILCSSYKTVANGGLSTIGNLPDMSITQRNTFSGVTVKDAQYTDAVAFKSAMSGVQIVYELATPVEYQITPEEINTMIGANNIWADTGDVSVKYRTH